jgi:Fur family ferric uptake transcriptional regulator
MDNYITEFRYYLKSKGLKFTPERRIILKEVFSFHHHFDVDQLYDKLRKHSENISRATIYRTLPLLVESELIRETLRCQGKVSYEHVFGHKHHDHMVCIGCGKVIEFRDERIEKLQDALCKKYSFQPKEHRLGIRGYCKKCRDKRGSK